MSSITVGLLEGRNLPPADPNGLSDPFCELQIRGRDPNNAKRSQVVKKTVCPRWMEPFQFSGVAPLDVLVVKVFDWDRVGTNNLLGVVNVSFEQMVQAFHSPAKSAWFALGAPALKGEVLLSFDICPVPPVPTSAAENGELYAALPVPAQTSSTVITAEDIPRYHVPLQPVPHVAGSVSMYVTFQNKLPTAEEPAIGVSGCAMRVVCHVIVHGPLQAKFRNILMTFSGKSKGSSAFFTTKEHILDDVRDILHGPVALAPGHHVVPFQIWLSEQMPSSIAFEDVIKVHYTLKLSADIVDSPDCILKVPVRVVNLNDTPYSVAGQGRNGPAQIFDIKKSPLNAGGPISARLTIPRTRLAPGEEFEVMVELENKTSRRIKRMEFELRRITSASTYNSDRDTLLEVKKKFYPYVQSNCASKQLFVVEIPRNLHSPHSYSRGKFKLEYVMRVIVDIPLSRDAYVDVPFCLLIPDPKKPVPSMQLNAQPGAFSVDMSPLTWTYLQTMAWIRERASAPNVANALSESILNGREFLSVQSDRWTEIVAAACSSCKVDVSDEELERFIAAHRGLVHRHLFPRSFLQSLGMNQYADAFEQAEIGYDELMTLGQQDPTHLLATLRSQFSMTLGASMRFREALARHMANIQH